MDKHKKAVFFWGGIIWEFTYCTIFREVGLLDEGDVYVVLMYEVIKFSVLRSKLEDIQRACGCGMGVWVSGCCVVNVVHDQV